MLKDSKAGLDNDNLIQSMFEQNMVAIKYYMKRETEEGENIILDTGNDKCLDIDAYKVYKMSDYNLTDAQKEIATVLIQDGWYSSFDDLIHCVRRLDEENK